MKKWTRWILTVFLAAVLVGCGRENPEQEERTYPREAVELIAPAGPGGGYDLTVRAMAQCLQETGLVSVPLPVTNKPGGGGRVCLEYMHEKRGSNDMLVVYSPPLCLINLNGSTALNYRDNTTPIAKLAVLMLFYQLAAAVMQPVCDKRVVSCVSGVSCGHKLLLKIVVSSLLLFVIAIAITCAATNVNYYTV